MQYLRQSTAIVYPVGPFVDDTDGKTLEEGLTIASIDIQLIQPLDTATVPPDLVTNGDMGSSGSWTENSWTIGSGVATSAGAQDTNLDQTLAITENVAYEVVYDVATQSAGTVTAILGTTSGTARSTVATFTETLVAGSGSLIRFDAIGFTGTIDNVVVKQVPIPITPAASGSTNDMVLSQSNTGMYGLELTAAQLGIVGRHKLTAFISGALIVFHEFTVLEEATYDAMYKAAAPGPVPGMVTGVVETSGSNSSTQVQTDLAEATNDHYDVMTIMFTSGAESGQSRLITGYVGSTGVVSWNAALTGTPADDVTFAIMSAGTTADAVWDEILTGASHNITNSSGKRLRQLQQAFTLASGTIANVGGGHTITLDAGAVATADFYEHARLQITEGTGAGQSRIITGYTSGRVATLDSDFVTNPNTASLYEIVAADVHTSVSSVDLAVGFVVTATSTTTMTLDAGAVATTDYYIGALINFPHGTGAGQTREITAYTSGRVATLSPALTTNVGAGTAYHIQGVISIPEIVDQIWNEARSGHTTAGTYGESFDAIVSGLAETGTLSTTVMTSDLSESTDDHYIGRTIIWTSGVLVDQASDITDYAGSAGTVTYTQVTEAPANGDSFIIV